jgi:hypothetical protein
VSSRVIQSLADVRPGDLMFTNIGGLIPGVFPVKLGQLLLGERVRLGPLSVDHVGVVVEAGERKPVVDLPNGPLLNYDGWSGVTSPRLVQAMPRGAEEIYLDPARHWTPGVAFCRLPEDYPGQAADAAAIARLFVTEKVPYSFLSYAALAAWRYGIKAERLERWIDRRRPPIDAISAIALTALPAEAICSVLADQAWSLAGKRVMEGVAHQAVTPGALALRCWADGDVEWGGAGLL